jgi:hypothetical protein
MKQLFQFRRLGKKLLLPLLASTISLAASAQPYFQQPLIESREVELAQQFNEVEVIGDVTIILTNNLEGKISFQGDAGEIRQAKATVKNKKLVIDVNRKRSIKKFVVYLPASKINLLTTTGKTEIRSSGTINTSNLEIYLNGSAFVSVRYIGKLQVVPGTGYELDYTKK